MEKIYLDFENIDFQLSENEVVIFDKINYEIYDTTFEKIKSYGMLPDGFYIDINSKRIVVRCNYQITKLLFDTIKTIRKLRVS